MWFLTSSFLLACLQRAQVASRPAYSPLAKTRPGAADPSPGSMAPVYPWSVGMGPLRQDYLAAIRAPAPGPCKVRVRCGTRLVAGPGPNQMACPIRTLSVAMQGDVPLPVQGGSGGIPRPFEGGIGGPGGHRGEVGIPPAPLAGGATPRRKKHIAGSTFTTFHILASSTPLLPFLVRGFPWLTYLLAPCYT